MLSLGNSNAPSVLGIGPAAALLGLPGVEARTIDAQGTIVNGSTGSSIALLATAFPATPLSLEILSSNANDTAAGTGARLVRITGLDANFARQQQTVTLNGVAAVAIPGTWMSVDKVEVITAGGALRNVGQLTVRIAGAGANQIAVPINGNRQNSSNLSVPTGETGIVLAASCVVTPDQADVGPPEVWQQLAVIVQFLLTMPSGLVYESVQLALPFSVATPTGLVFPALPGGTRMRATALLPSGATPAFEVRVSLLLSVLLVRNDLLVQANLPVAP